MIDNQKQIEIMDDARKNLDDLIELHKEYIDIMHILIGHCYGDGLHIIRQKFIGSTRLDYRPLEIIAVYDPDILKYKHKLKYEYDEATGIVSTDYRYKVSILYVTNEEVEDDKNLECITS